MPDLKFKGEVIPVTHLMPDDVLVFRTTIRCSSETLCEIRHMLREEYSLERRQILVMDSIDLSIQRDGQPIPVGES